MSSYAVPGFKETKAMIKFYESFRRSPKHVARAQFEYMKSILERHTNEFKLCTHQVEGKA